MDELKAVVEDFKDKLYRNLKDEFLRSMYRIVENLAGFEAKNLLTEYYAGLIDLKEVRQDFRDKFSMELNKWFDDLIPYVEGTIISEFGALVDELADRELFDDRS